MKKIVYRISCLILIVLHMVIPVAAETYVFDGADKSNTEQAWHDFLAALPEQLREEVTEWDLANTSSFSKMEDLLTTKYWKEKILGSVKSGFTFGLSALTSIWGMLLLTAICRQIPVSASSGVFFFCSDLCMALTIFNAASAVMEQMETFLGEICSVMTAMIPVMAAVSYSSGEVTSAAVNRTALTLFVTTLNQLQRSFFVPFGQALYSFSIIAAVCNQIQLGGFLASAKKLFTTLFGFMMLIYSFVFGIQTSLARSADSLGLRTVKFAMGNFIPVVGGTVADAFSAVREGFGYIKTMTGIGGIVVLLCMLLPVALSLLSFHIVLSCCQTSAELLECSSSARLLGDTQSILQMLAAFLWLSVMFFCFAIILFTKNSVSAS